MGSSHLPGKMQQKYRLAGWVFADFVIGIAAYMIAYSLQNQLWLFKSINIIGFVLSATLITILVLFVMQVYQMYWPRTRGHNVAILLQAVLFATIINLLINFFWNPQPIPFNVLAVA
jgi:FlaA1/EpsC-like NDP-sugar epimerase